MNSIIGIIIGLLCYKVILRPLRIIEARNWAKEQGLGDQLPKLKWYKYFI